MTRALIALVLIASTAAVRADAKSEADRLFDEGVALRDAGKVKEACAKFAEAMKKDERAIGTLLNLALCAEKDGQVATAVRLFGEARDRAGEQDMAAQKSAAEEHLAALARRVPHLTIKLAKPLPGMKILVDDQVVTLGALTHLPVDPGMRVVNVSAPDHLPFETKIDIAEGKSQDLDVPALAEGSTTVVVKSSKRTIGKIAAIGGAIALGASVGLALYARSIHQREFEEHINADGVHYFPCGGPDRGPSRAEECDAGGLKGTERGRTFGTIATIVGGVGLVSAGVGLYLWLTAPVAGASSSTETRAHIVPVVSTESVGLATTLRW